MKEIEYEHSGRTFKVRSWTEEARFVVAGFEDGSQITLAYGCDVGTAHDLWLTLKESAASALHDAVRADIRARLEAGLL